VKSADSVPPAERVPRAGAASRSRQPAQICLRLRREGALGGSPGEAVEQIKRSGGRRTTSLARVGENVRAHARTFVGEPASEDRRCDFWVKLDA
jgi:hypothetical protein